MEKADSLSLYYFLLPVLSTIFIGGVMTVVYKFIGFIQDRITAKFTASIYIENSDPMYEWLVDYLLEKGFSKHAASNLSVKTERKNKLGFLQTSVTDDVEKPDVNYRPDVGFHSFLYEGVKINVFHYVGKTITTGFDRTPTKMESLMLSCFGPSNISLLKSICNDAMEFALSKNKGETQVYALRPYGSNWEKVLSKKPRLLDSVILDSNIAEEVIEDIKNFHKSQKWYMERGVPYRRGYLLYGPPGTGKTSFMLAVAAELKLSVCTMNLAREMDDNQLNSAMEGSPKNSIILLEDIDAIFVERTSVNESKGRRISFSGLLNAIDGVRTQEGRILFMSTNHIEKLDPAMLRPGRSDVHVKLDYASQDQIKRMFLRFFPEAKKELIEEFLKIVPEKKLSMAKLQGHFLRNKKDAKKVVENAKNLVKLNEFTNEMSIANWLFRLNLEQFTEGFLNENISTVADLSDISESDLEKFSLKKAGDKKRILNMINGDEFSKKAFEYMSHQSMRSFLGFFIKNSKEIEGFIKLIPENYITEFHLRDIFEKDFNKSFETKARDLLEKVQLFHSGKKIKKTKKEEVKKYPKESPTEILERLKLEEFIPKFKEQGVLEQEFFYKLNEGLMTGLGITSYGMKKLLMKEIDEFNKKEVNEEDNIEKEVSLKKIQRVLLKTKSIQY